MRRWAWWGIGALVLAGLVVGVASLARDLRGAFDDPLAQPTAPPRPIPSAVLIVAPTVVQVSPTPPASATSAPPTAEPPHVVLTLAATPVPVTAAIVPTATATSAPTATASPTAPPTIAPEALAFRADRLAYIDRASAALTDVIATCPTTGAFACTMKYSTARNLLYEVSGQLLAPPRPTPGQCRQLAQDFGLAWGRAESAANVPVPNTPSGFPDSLAIARQATAVRQQIEALRPLLLGDSGTCR